MNILEAATKSPNGIVCHPSLTSKYRFSLGGFYVVGDNGQNACLGGLSLGDLMKQGWEPWENRDWVEVQGAVLHADASGVHYIKTYNFNNFTLKADLDKWDHDVRVTIIGKDYEGLIKFNKNKNFNLNQKIATNLLDVLEKFVKDNNL